MALSAPMAGGEPIPATTAPAFKGRRYRRTKAAKDALHARIIEAAERMNATEIAAKEHIDPSYAAEVLRNAGLSTYRKRGTSTELYARIVELEARGKSAPEIALALELSETYVYRLKRKYSDRQTQPAA